MNCSILFVNNSDKETGIKKLIGQALAAICWEIATILMSTGLNMVLTGYSLVFM
jgi:hypothetical protein